MPPWTGARARSRARAAPGACVAVGPAALTAPARRPGADGGSRSCRVGGRAGLRRRAGGGPRARSVPRRPVTPSDRPTSSPSPAALLACGVAALTVESLLGRPRHARPARADRPGPRPRRRRRPGRPADGHGHGLRGPLRRGGGRVPHPRAQRPRRAVGRVVGAGGGSRAVRLRGGRLGPALAAGAARVPVLAQGGHGGRGHRAHGRGRGRAAARGDRGAVLVAAAAARRVLRPGRVVAVAPTPEVASTGARGSRRRRRRHRAGARVRVVRAVGPEPARPAHARRLPPRAGRGPGRGLASRRCVARRARCDARARRSSWALLLGRLTVLKVLDLGAFVGARPAVQRRDRPRPARVRAWLSCSDSLGPWAAAGSVVARGRPRWPAVVVCLPWAVGRLTRLVAAPPTGRRSESSRPGGRVGRLRGVEVCRSRRASRSRRPTRGRFVAEQGARPVAVPARPGAVRPRPRADRLRGPGIRRTCRALTGKDVLLVFVESYGRVAVEGPESEPVRDACWMPGPPGCGPPGYAARSAFLTSPTFGGSSWLAHATLQSGLPRRRPVAATTGSSRAAARRSPPPSAGRAGARWPCCPRHRGPWPEGQAFYRFDDGLRPVRPRVRRADGSASPPCPTSTPWRRSSGWSWPCRTAPRSWPRSSSPRATGRGRRCRPWSTRPPSATARSSTASGADAVTAEQLWSDRGRCRRRTGRPSPTRWPASSPSWDVTATTTSWSSLLGDHQPSTVVSGFGGNRDVPVTVIAHDPAVVEQIAGLGLAGRPAARRERTRRGRWRRSGTASSPPTAPPRSRRRRDTPCSRVEAAALDGALWRARASRLPPRRVRRSGELRDARARSCRWPGVPASRPGSRCSTCAVAQRGRACSSPGSSAAPTWAWTRSPAPSRWPVERAAGEGLGCPLRVATVPPVPAGPFDVVAPARDPARVPRQAGPAARGRLGASRGRALRLHRGGG